MVRVRVARRPAGRAAAPGAHRLPHRVARRGGGHPRLAPRDARAATGSSPATASSARRCWRGMPLQRYIDNMFGNANDPVQGPADARPLLRARGATSASISSPIGTQITQAVGFAWAAKLEGDDWSPLVYFGDGATSSQRLPQRAELRRRVQGAGRVLLPQQRLGDQRARASGRPRARPSPSKARRLRHARRARRRQRPLRGRHGRRARRVERARARRGPDADRGASPTAWAATRRATIPRPTAHETRLEPWTRARSDRARCAATSSARRLDRRATRAQLETSIDAELKRGHRGRREARRRRRSRRCSTTSTRSCRWHLREQRAELLAAARAPKAHGSGTHRDARSTAGTTMPQMNMVQAVNDALRIEMRRDDARRRARRGRRQGRRRVPRDRGPVRRVRRRPRDRHAARRGRHHRHRDRHGALRPAAGARDPVRRLHLPGVRPDRQRAGEVSATARAASTRASS